MGELDGTDIPDDPSPPSPTQRAAERKAMNRFTLFAVLHDEKRSLSERADEIWAALADAISVAARLRTHIEKWAATEKHGKCWRESECVFCMNRRVLEDVPALATPAAAPLPSVTPPCSICGGGRDILGDGGPYCRECHQSGDPVAPQLSKETP